MEKMMHKRWMLFLSLLGLCMAACGGKTTAQVTPTPTIEPIILTTLSQPDCTVVTTLPTSAPEDLSRYPAVSDSDWSQGPKDAVVTLVEYSDFQ
jgi:hypothetical protein